MTEQQPTVENVEEEQVTHQIQVLDLDALDVPRHRTKIGGRQYAVKRQADLSDRDATRLDDLDAQVRQMDTLAERMPLHVERMKLMLHDQPPDDVLEAMPEGKIRHLGLFFIRIWRTEFQNSLDILTVDQMGNIVEEETEQKEVDPEEGVGEAIPAGAIPA